MLKLFKSTPMFKTALLVPTAIMLLFSLFALTAPPDGERIAASFRLGIVNQDDGLIFPPIRVSSRLLEGLSETMPFAMSEFESKEEARAALNAGDLAAVLIFPAEFSKQAIGSETVDVEIWNANHLSITENQIGAQLPNMLQLGMSAAVSMVRLAFAKGELPTNGLPVKAKVETFHKANSAAQMISPFIFTYATWLAAFVGSMLLFQGSDPLPKGAGKAALCTGFPVLATGIASLIGSLVFASVTGEWSTFLSVWAAIWFGCLCLSWLIGGIFSILKMPALLIVIPTVFYQNALGGGQMNASAAPTWLRSFTSVFHFEELGAGYRSIILGGDMGFPITELAIAALIGLALIWTGSLLRKGG